MPSLLRHCTSAAGLILLLAAAGCPTPSSGPTPAAPQPTAAGPLTLLVVDDPPLGKAIASEWKSQFEGALEVSDVSLATVLSAKRLPGDAVIFPVGHVGQLAEQGLIVPLDEQALAAGQFDRRDIFDEVRRGDITWGKRTVAVPLGSPQLLVAYRRDLLAQLALQPPADWRAYQALVEKLAAQAGETKLQPTIEPLADGWAGQVLLARAAAYATHRDQVSPLFDYFTLEPLITQAPYVRALTELVAASKGAPPDQRLTPAQAMDELCAGRAAMALTWPSPGRPDAKVCELPLAFALVPGATESYNFARKHWEPREAGDDTRVPLVVASGRVAAVTSTAASAAAAQNFLTWLAGREASAAVCPASAATTLFRDSHVSQPQRWASGLDAQAAKAYALALQESASLPRGLALRLPGRDEYLAALDAAVHEAVAGEKSPAEALAAAAEKWRATTAAQGLENQQRALRRSLGLEGLK